MKKGGRVDGGCMAVTDETQRRISQFILTKVIQGRLLTLFGHVARLDDSSDAKQILTSSPMTGRALGRRRKTVHNDMDCHKLTWTEAANLVLRDPWGCRRLVVLRTHRSACRRRRDDDAVYEVR